MQVGSWTEELGYLKCRAAKVKPDALEIQSLRITIAYTSALRLQELVKSVRSQV